MVLFLFWTRFIMRKPDGSVKLCIYRKKTHTNQYLQFSSHHPLHHKLGVIRTLLDRSDSIATEVEDKEKEEQNICQALAACGYPEWTVNKVKKDRSQPKQKPPAKKQSDGEKSKGLVVVPYVQGLSEHVTRVFKKHGFATALKPDKTLRSLLVHLKDKLEKSQKAQAIYEIPCADCRKSYIGETGRPFGVRLANTRKKFKYLNLCTTSGQHARLLWQSNTSLPLQITLQQLITPSTGRKLKSLIAKRTSALDG